MIELHVDKLVGGNITITTGSSAPSEPTAPQGKVLYKTSSDGEWLQSDANIADGNFFGFDEKYNAVAVIIPSKDASGNDVTSIGDGTFSACSGLTSVTIPNSVTSIGSEAFEYCSGMTSMTIGSGLTSIRNYAFYNCSGLTGVTIPDSVTRIGDGVFYGCSGLTSVTFLGKTLEQVQNIEDGYGNKYYPWGITNTSIITVA